MSTEEFQDYPTVKTPELFLGLLFAYFIIPPIFISVFMYIVHLIKHTPDTLNSLTRIQPYWGLFAYIFVQPFIVIPILVFSLCLIFFLIFFSRRKKDAVVGRHAYGFVSISYLLVFYSFTLIIELLMELTLYHSPLLSGNRLTVVILVLLIPFFAAILLILRLKKTADLEIAKAYQSVDQFNDNYRQKYVQTHSDELLAKEEQILRDYPKYVRFKRLDLISALSDANIDILKRYHQEPVMLLKLAKAYQIGAQNLTQTTGATIMSEDSKLPVPIPDTFDLKKIEQDLAKYRLDQNALASYVSGLTKRFKADQQLKKLEKLFQFYDIAIQYKDKEYKFKEKQHDLSLLDLKKQQEKEQLEAGIERARTEKAQELKKQRDLLQPRAETQPQPKKDALQEYEEEARFESRKKIINAKIEAETNEKIKEIARNDLENSTRSYETYVKNTKSNPNLSEDAKKEMIRLREQILIKELDELERRL